LQVPEELLDLVADVDQLRVAVQLRGAAGDREVLDVRRDRNELGRALLIRLRSRILVQLAETPDGLRYVSIAKGLVKASGRFDRTPRRYAVALGCELSHAEEFIYADGLDIASPKAMTPIGVSCRICPRTDCDQRAYPPSDRSISVDLFHRGVVPFKVAPEGRPRRPLKD
jgi:hypothetical protein